MLEDFKANKMVAEGGIAVDVVRFNGAMAICGDDEGAVLINIDDFLSILIPQ